MRPALILARDQDDFIVAFITPSPYRSDWVVEMTVSDPEFAVTGLTGDSRILLTKIATLHRVLVQRRLGRIGPETQSKVHESLQQLFSY